jgi:hypothetical protein
MMTGSGTELSPSNASHAGNKNMPPPVPVRSDKSRWRYAKRTSRDMGKKIWQQG